MAEANRNTLNIRRNKTLIIAVAVVVLIVIFMYFHDQNQQRAFELRRLEKRVEWLEEWGKRR
jgi:cell division protein FtsN